MASLLQTQPVQAGLLWVHGAADSLVPFEKTKDLALCFLKPELYAHEGGHVVPSCNGLFKNTLVSFLEMQQAGTGQSQGQPQDDD